VGLSTPKQEPFMAAFLHKLDTKLMRGVGAAFDIHTGRIADSHGCRPWVCNGSIGCSRIRSLPHYHATVADKAVRIGGRCQCSRTLHFLHFRFPFLILVLV
jgi:hypothetical protein